ncbi:MAG: CoA transferase [Dehalococcoidia bacterium]
MSGPLEGVLVLDFSRVYAGPHCARMLVDMGADVIKIEPPEGDLIRFFTPRKNSLATQFVQQNCGKRNISLDLARPEARELLVRLAAKADVLVENFRPGVMRRLGLGFERLSALNPRLVYASISGYGQEGPANDRRAYAALVAAEVGFLDLLAFWQKAEVGHDSYSHADFYSAIECLAAINAALYQRERTGRGQHVEVCMAEALLCVNEFACTVLSGFNPGEGRIPGIVSSPIFQTTEGHRITVAGDPCLRDNFASWLRALGRPELEEDPRFVDADARQANRDELIGLLQDWVLSLRDLDELGRQLQAAGHSYGVIRTMSEAAQSDWAKERGSVVEVSDRGDGVFRIPNSPWRFSSGSTGVRGEPAYRGEHNREVLGGLLELSEAELDGLERDGVLSSRVPDPVGS